LTSEKTIWLPILEGNSTNLDSIIADHSVEHLLVILALWLVMMLVIERSKGICAFSCERAVKIMENSSLGELVPNLLSGCRIKDEAFSFDGPSTRVSSCIMEAMRASRESTSLIPVEIKELGSINIKVFGSWCDNTFRASPLEQVLCVSLGLADYESIVDGGPIVTILISERELNACKEIVGNLEIIEPYIADSFGDCTIPIILPADKIIEISCDWRILMVRIG